MGHLENKNVLLALTTLGLFINILVIANALMNSAATYSSLRIHLVISIILAIVPFLSLVHFVRKSSNIQLTTTHKIISMMTLFMSFGVPLAVLIMELYRF